jgi:hypothetical protein
VVVAGTAVFVGVVAGLAGAACAFGAGLPAGACVALATGPEMPKARHVTSATAAWLRERFMSMNLHGVRRWQADHPGKSTSMAHAGLSGASGGDNLL